MELISDREFSELVQFIKRYYGINLAQKRTLVIGRLHNYILQSGFGSFADYWQHVIADRSGDAGTVLVNKLTTNHTYFLREPKHFEFLQQEILPYLAEKEAGAKDLRIWSAGCSTGEEPYTVAMAVDSYFGAEKWRWDSKILATDISVHALEKAQNATYANHQLECMSREWRTRYFRKLDEATSMVADKIRNEVIFRRFNLMNQTFPFKKKFHLIFCRNVMIYFDAETKKELINRFYDHMESGGYLLIGHSESINRNESHYKFIMPAVYRKG